MPEERPTSEPPDSVMRPFAEFWKRYLEQANEQTKQVLTDAVDQSHTEENRRQWFDALSRSLDAYLRSPAFLQTMKSNIDATIRVRRKYPPASGTDTVSTEVQALKAKVEAMREQLMTRMDHLELRLGELDEPSQRGKQQ